MWRGLYGFEIRRAHCQHTLVHFPVIFIRAGWLGKVISTDPDAATPRVDYKCVCGWAGGVCLCEPQDAHRAHSPQALAVTLAIPFLFHLQRTFPGPVPRVHICICAERSQGGTAPSDGSQLLLRHKRGGICSLRCFPSALHKFVAISCNLSKISLLHALLSWLALFQCHPEERPWPSEIFLCPKLFCQAKMSLLIRWNYRITHFSSVLTVLLQLYGFLKKKEIAGVQHHFHINTNICAASVYLLILKKTPKLFTIFNCNSWVGFHKMLKVILEK